MMACVIQLHALLFHFVATYFQFSTVVSHIAFDVAEVSILSFLSVGI